MVCYYIYGLYLLLDFLMCISICITIYILLSNVKKMKEYLHQKRRKLFMKGECNFFIKSLILNDFFLVLSDVIATILHKIC